MVWTMEREGMNMVYILVGLAGFIGAVFRYALSVIITPINPAVFPLATLLINWIGCFSLPLVTFYFFERYQIRQIYRTAISTGLIGSFTTFSTVSVELVRLLEENQLFLAMLYLMMSLFGGIFMCYLGLIVSRKKELRC